MEFTAESAKKTLSVSDGRLKGGSIVKLESLAEYTLAPADEVTEC